MFIKAVSARCLLMMCFVVKLLPSSLFAWSNPQPQICKNSQTPELTQLCKTWAAFETPTIACRLQRPHIFETICTAEQHQTPEISAKEQLQREEEKFFWNSPRGKECSFLINTPTINFIPLLSCKIDYQNIEDNFEKYKKLKQLIAAIESKQRSIQSVLSQLSDNLAYQEIKLTGALAVLQQLLLSYKFKWPPSLLNDAKQMVHHCTDDKKNCHQSINKLRSTLLKIAFGSISNLLTQLYFSGENGQGPPSPLKQEYLKQRKHLGHLINELADNFFKLQDILFAGLSQQQYIQPLNNFLNTQNAESAVMMPPIAQTSATRTQLSALLQKF